MITDWQAWGFAAVVGLGILAALLARSWHAAVLRVVPLEHAAAAGIIGFYAWNALSNIPVQAEQFIFMTAGIPDAGILPQQAFLGGYVVFVAGSIVAIGGILRRRAWAAVLGIGMSAASVTASILTVLALVSSLGEGGMPDGQFGWLAYIGGQAVPAVAAIVLLVLPLRRQPAVTNPEPRSSSSAHEGILEVDPTVAIDDWVEGQARVDPAR